MESSVAGHASLLIHKEGCKQFVLPKTNSDFWQAKINRNRERDQRNYDELTHAGWQVIVIWQCKLTKQKLESTMQQVAVTLNHNLLKILKWLVSFYIKTLTPIPKKTQPIAYINYFL